MNDRCSRPAAALGMAAAILLAALPASAATERYTVLIQGNEAGAMTVDRTGAALEVDFAFNDRGRGPELDSTIRLDERGLPMEVRTTGKEYFKGAVDETFHLRSGTARWESRGEEGSADVAGTAFYISFDGTPVELGLLARALVESETGTLDLLPAGTATLGAAEVTGRTDTLGSIAPGKLADLVLVPGNPLEDLAALRRAELVVKDGTVYEAAAIYRALGVAPSR